MATKQQLGNNFGHKKSKKSWAGMNLSERKRARTEYGQWKRSEEGRQGGTYHGVKPPKGWTAKSSSKATTAKKVAPKKTTTPAKAPAKAPPAKTHPFSAGQAGANKTTGRVKPTGPGNYSGTGRVGSGSTKTTTPAKPKVTRANQTDTRGPTWGGPKGWKFDGKLLTRKPKGLQEQRSWWNYQQKYNPLVKNKKGLYDLRSYLKKIWG